MRQALETRKLENFENIKNYPWDMLNNFCFYVYAQKCQVAKVVKLSGCQVVKFDPWDMLNNFCFDVYAQKSMFIGENGNGFLGTTAAAHP